MGSRFTELVVDCVDPARVAAFWSAVLARPAVPDEHDPPQVWEVAPPEGPSLVFVAVPEPKTVKDRLHIDLNPVGCEQAEEVERLLALGAVRVDVGQGEDVRWVVLADVEGNEFCVLRTRRE